MPDIAKRLILYGVLALCLVGYGFVEGKAAQQTADAVNYGKLALGGHAGFQRELRADSLAIVRLRGVQAQYVASEGRWRKLADSLLADTLGDSGEAKPPDFPAATVALGKALQACDASRVASDSALQVLTQDLQLCKARGDTLETAIGRLLKVKAPRWGFTVGPAILGQPNGSVHLGLALVFGYRF